MRTNRPREDGRTNPTTALDATPADEFVASVSPLFERAPAFLARLAAARPFGSWDGLFAAARRIAHEMPEAEQVELVDAHPRLGAPPGSVSAMSFVEQGYEREGPVAVDVDRERSRIAAVDVDRERSRIAAVLEDLNATYEARFGFRYCVFVAGRPRDDLVPEMAEALTGERDSELRRALDAVIDIAIDRHVKSGTVSG